MHIRSHTFDTNNICWKKEGIANLLLEFCFKFLMAQASLILCLVTLEIEPVFLHAITNICYQTVAIIPTTSLWDTRGHFHYHYCAHYC